RGVLPRTAATARVAGRDVAARRPRRAEPAERPRLRGGAAELGRRGLPLVGSRRILGAARPARPALVALAARWRRRYRRNRRRLRRLALAANAAGRRGADARDRRPPALAAWAADARQRARVASARRRAARSRD